MKYVGGAVMIAMWAAGGLIALQNGQPALAGLAALIIAGVIFILADS
ncbi:MAG: hypothetical protein AAF467_01345 [Actinomycetota bacterium]